MKMCEGGGGGYCVCLEDRCVGGGVEERTLSGYEGMVVSVYSEVGMWRAWT